MRRPFTPNRAKRSWASSREGGVTLPELIVYALIAVAITGSVAGSLIAIIQNERNLEIQQRAIRLWSRISFLIESEVSEGNRILYNRPTPCGSASLFTIQVPFDNGDTKDIHYYTQPVAGTGNILQLWRCGPPYLANGSLNPAQGASAALVGQRLILEVEQPDPDNPDAKPELSRTLTYTFDVQRPDGKRAFLSPRTTIARTRIAEVTGP